MRNAGLATRPVAQLAEFLSGASYEGLPWRASEHAKFAISSTLASAAVGATLPSAGAARALAVAQGGVPEATIWFSDGTRLPVAETARVNAVSSDAAASDDSDFRTIAHSGTAVTAAALALGESSKASGRAVLEAVVVGYEACGRFGEAAPDIGERGLHPVILNSFGAAAAAAKLLGAPPDRMLDALVLAATTASGLLVGTNGWAREYQAGTAVLEGVRAALAAYHGFHVEPRIVDGPDGFLTTVAGHAADPEALARDLGDEWDIATDLGIKLRPGGYPFAAAVEAAIDASQRLGGPPGEIASIVVSGPRFRGPVGHRRPKDFVEAIHSLAYYLAVGASDRRFDWDSLSPAKLNDPKITRLLALVGVDPDPPDGNAGYGFPWGATVTVTNDGGASATARVDVPIGSARRGIAPADVEDKLRALMMRAGHDKAMVKDLVGTLARIDEIDDISALTTGLRSVAAPR